jgi:hypothetical protein
MNNNRSATPEPNIINIPVGYRDHLREYEFEKYSLTPNRIRIKNAPPAPRRGFERVDCQCGRAYLIVSNETNKTLTGHDRCGYCDTVG